MSLRAGAVLTLDNLFLVLYEDLRVYTIWRAEISHFQMQHMSYRKTGTEVRLQKHFCS